MRVSEIMTAPVHTVSPGASPGDAQQLMRRHRVRHLVVTEAGRVVGVLSDHDLRETSPDAANEGWQVQDLMNTNVAAVADDDTIRRVANLMRGRSIGCVVVTRDGDLAGIITVSDLLNLLGKGRERPERPARAHLHYRVPHRKQHRERSW